MTRLLVVAAVLASVAVHASDALSVMDVVGRAKVLNGQRISVVGYVTFEFEGHGVYESEESLKTHAFDRSIALDIYRPDGEWTDTEIDKWHQLKDKYETLYEGKKVVIRGTYRSGPSGHLGVVPGGELLVEKITLHK